MELTKKEAVMQKQRVSFFLVISVMTMVSFAKVAWTQMQQNPTAQAAIPESAAIPQDRIPQHIRDAVNATDRPATDKNLDAGRQPEQMLTFFGIQPGMKVADLWAGTGYTTELLSRIVGTSGMVYSQNPPLPPEFQPIVQAWTDRLKNPVLKNVSAVNKSFVADDVLLAPPGSLDVVVMNMNYHDLVLRNIDRAKVNAAVAQALKAGGAYAIIDHSAKDGSGVKDLELHRIDEQFLISEVQKAGFTLVARSSALRHAGDDRTWSASPRVAGERRGTTDRFMLLFKKP
jgi:predicted methyltransferase